MSRGRRASSLLADLELFDEPTSSALTFLRIFTARSYMLDVEVIFGGRKARTSCRSALFFVWRECYHSSHVFSVYRPWRLEKL